MATEPPDDARTFGEPVALEPVAMVETKRLPRPLFLILFYLAAVALAEALTTFADPRLGQLAHAALLIALSLRAAADWEWPHGRLLAAVAFGPLIRLISLSLPLAGFPRPYWYLVTGLPLMVAAAVAARSLGFSRQQVGISMRWLPLQLVVALAGLAFGYVEYQILRPQPLVKGLAWEQLWWPALILLLCTGFGEELIFCGVIQRAAVELMEWWGVLYTTGLFAILHLGYKSAPDLALVFVAGLFFGAVAYWSRSIVGVSLAHGLTNVVLLLVMPQFSTWRPPWPLPLPW